MSWIFVDHSWKVGGRKMINGSLLRSCLMVMISNLNSAFPRDLGSVCCWNPSVKPRLIVGQSSQRPRRAVWAMPVREAGSPARNSTTRPAGRATGRRSVPGDQTRRVPWKGWKRMTGGLFVARVISLNTYPRIFGARGCLRVSGSWGSYNTGGK